MHEGAIVEVISSKSKFKGQYGFVYKGFQGGRWGVVLAPTSKKVTYTISGVKEILRGDPGIRKNAFHKAWEARNKYFEPLPDDPDFIAVVQPEDGSKRHGGGRREEKSKSRVDIEELVFVLQGLQKSVENLGGNMNDLIQRVATLESAKNSSTDIYTDADVVPTDYMDSSDNSAI